MKKKDIILKIKYNYLKNKCILILVFIISLYMNP